MNKKPLGELLIEEGLVTREQLNEALRQQKLEPGLTIGQQLCKMGFFCERDLTAVLEQTGKRQQLSAVLRKSSLVSEQKLNSALSECNNDESCLAKTLLKNRDIDEETLAKAIAMQYDLDYFAPETVIPDKDLAHYISPAFATKHTLAPMAKEKKALTLIMTKPLAYFDTLQLENTLNLSIVSVIASRVTVAKVIKELYQISIPLENVVTGVVQQSSITDLLESVDHEDDTPEVEETSQVSEQDSVLVKLVNKIVYDAYSRKSSDIHIEPYPGKKDIDVRIRIDGYCSVYQKIPYKYKYAIPSRIKIMANLDIAERRKPQDGKIDFKKYGPLDIELRVATMPTVGGLEDVVMRILASGKPIPFEKLGLTRRNIQAFQRSVKSPYGLVLVVGPTGSGKTTTLHSALATINTPDRKIWTAEDPVEITQEGLRQVQVNPRIGFTFASALRSFLRLDPDVIMIGEMRDEETASIGIEASLTGHLVFSTLHTNSAAETVLRLLDMGLDPFGFSDSLLCVLAQRLARSLCPDCKEPYKPEQEELKELIIDYGIEPFRATGINPSSITLARAVGCSRCDNTGYKGRIGIHELLEATEPMKELIKHKATSEVIRKQAATDGMLTLRQDGILKVMQGLTDIHEIRRVTLK